MIVVGLAAFAYQGDEGTRAARASWALVLFTRRHIERDDGASDVVGIAADRGIVMLVRPSPWPSSQGCATQTSK